MAVDPTTVLGRAMTSGVQLAYFTNDTRTAIERFENELGIGPWVSREAELDLIDAPDGTAFDCRLRASFAYMKGRMFELIEVLGDESPIFPALPDKGFAIVPHHVGAFQDDADEVVAAAKAVGMHYYRFSGRRGDIVFVDTRRVVGHWLEALCFENLNPV